MSGPEKNTRKIILKASNQQSKQPSHVKETDQLGQLQQHEIRLTYNNAAGPELYKKLSCTSTPQKKEEENTFSMWKLCTILTLFSPRSASVGLSDEAK